MVAVLILCLDAAMAIYLVLHCFVHRNRRLLVNKRDFLKSTVALAAAPAILSRTAMAAAPPAQRQTMRAALKDRGPTPSYVFDSDRNAMTFYRADTTSFATFAYMAA